VYPSQTVDSVLYILQHAWSMDDVWFCVASGLQTVNSSTMQAYFTMLSVS